MLDYDNKFETWSYTNYKVIKSYALSVTTHNVVLFNAIFVERFE